MRKWHFWYGLGIRSKHDRYDSGRDWEVVDAALNARTTFPLSFLVPFDKLHRRLFDEGEGEGRKEIFTTYVKWRNVPNPDRAVRLRWSKVNRALKRLYAHLEIASYSHHVDGRIQVVLWDRLPRLSPAKYPVFTYRAHVPEANKTWVHCPSETSVEERRADKRLEPLRFRQYAHTREMLGLTTPRSVESYVEHVVDVAKAVQDRRRQWDDMRTALALLNELDLMGGTCKTWCDTTDTTLERTMEFGTWRRYTQVPVVPHVRRTREDILNTIHMEKGTC